MLRPLHIFLFFISLFANSYLVAQFNCDEAPSAIANLEGNAVVAKITTGGDLWWDGDTGGYQVLPQGALAEDGFINSVFVGGLWMGGFDHENRVILAAQQYGRAATNNFDYHPGPLLDDGNGLQNCTDWDTIFSITAVEVADYLAGFIPQVTTLNDVPLSIRGWPAKGNPHFASLNGFELVDRINGLAPFVDVNDDGRYDPLDGDYPAFSGDRALWCVFNAAGINRQSGTPLSPLIEVQLLAYSQDAPDDDPLQRTTFYEYTLLNQSNHTIDSFFVGHWTHSEFGCDQDDRANSVPSRNLYYVYDQIDTLQQCFSIGEEEAEVTYPVNVFQVLSTSADQEQKMYSFYTILNETGDVTLPEPGSGGPNTLNIFNGLWSTGEPFTRGAGGFGAGGGITRYMFDGGPTESGEPWLSGNVAYDQTMGRNLYSTGPYNLPPLGTASFTLATTSVFNVPRPDGETPDTTILFEAADNVEAWFLSARPVSTSESEYNAATITVFPNPTTNRITFRTNNLRPIRQVEIFDGVGRSLIVQTGNASTLEIDLAAQGLAPGVYFYRVTDATGQITSGKVVLR